MLQSTSAAASLRLGLASAFRTRLGHFVPDIVKQTQGMLGHLGVMRTYHKRDLEAITSEFDDVRAYGEGTADEWRKGLAQTGKDAMADASRWERWENNLPLGTVLADLLREYDPSSFPRYVQGLQQLQQQAVVPNGNHVIAQLPNGKQRYVSLLSFQSPFSLPCQARLASLQILRLPAHVTSQSGANHVLHPYVERCLTLKS